MGFIILKISIFISSMGYISLMMDSITLILFLRSGWKYLIPYKNFSFQASVTLKDEIENPVDYARYTPKCSKNDLNKMLDFHEYKKSKQFRGAESKLREIESAKRFEPQRPFTGIKPEKRLIKSATENKKMRPSSSYKILMGNPKNDNELEIMNKYEKLMEDGENEEYFN